MIVSAAVATIVLEVVYSIVKLTDIFQFAVFGGIPPGILSGTADFAEIYFHRASGVVVHHQIIFAACGDGTVVAFSVCAGNDGLVGYTFEEGESQHQVFEILHLVKARIVQGIVPGFLCTVCTANTGFEELHDGIVTIGMSEGTGKYRPVGITAHIVIFPAQFILIVQTVRNFLVDRFTVDDGFHGICGHTAFYEAPVIFFGILFNRIITVTETLSVAAMPALEHVEVQPGSGIEPR